MNPDRAVFLDFCSVITGYSNFILEGTGLVDTYQELIETVLGPKLSSEFYGLAKSVVSHPNIDERENQVRTSVLSSSTFWPVVSGLIALWYLGTWAQLPDRWYAAAGLPVPGPNDPGRTHVPTPGAYTEQLSYRTAVAHPPGAKPTGYGSWSTPPVVSFEVVSQEAV
jgi:hypothetical protein